MEARNNTERAGLKYGSKETENQGRSNLNQIDRQKQTWKGSISHSNLLFMLALVSTEGLFAYATEMLMH